MATCPYNYDVGEPARRGSCALKVSPPEGIDPVEQCFCDHEMIQLSGSGPKAEGDDPTVGSHYITDPQTILVTDYWIAAEQAERDADAAEFRAGRPTI